MYAALIFDFYAKLTYMYGIRAICLSQIGVIWSFSVIVLLWSLALEMGITRFHSSVNLLVSVDMFSNLVNGRTDTCIFGILVEILSGAFALFLSRKANIATCTQKQGVLCKVGSSIGGCLTICRTI